MTSQPTFPEIPRQPKRLRQPKKAVLRDQLALAADTIIRERLERSEPEPARLSLWQRITRKRA